METAFHNQGEIPTRHLLETANRVLDCVRNRNLDGLVSLFNEANRTVWHAGRTVKFRRDLERQLETGSRKFAHAPTVTEIREICRDDRLDFHAIAGKVIQEKHLMYTITLTREGDAYRFDHLGTPYVYEFESWKKFRGNQEPAEGSE